MQTQAIETTTTPKKAAAKRRHELLTQADVAALLRFDEAAGELHWHTAPKGRRKDQTRAGCEVRRKGKVCGRVLSISGQRWRESHVVALLQTGELPASSRRSKKAKGTRKAKASTSTPAVITVETPIAVGAPLALPAPKPATPAPIVASKPAIPRPELSRAAIAKARPEHRGWLFGAAKAVARAIAP